MSKELMFEVCLQRTITYSIYFIFDLDTDLLPTIKSVLECLRPKLISGDEELGLPPLDPLELDDVNLNTERYGFRGIKLWSNRELFQRIPNS